MTDDRTFAEAAARIDEAMEAMNPLQRARFQAEASVLLAFRNHATDLVPETKNDFLTKALDLIFAVSRAHTLETVAEGLAHFLEDKDLASASPDKLRAVVAHIGIALCEQATAQRLRADTTVEHLRNLTSLLSAPEGKAQ